MVDTFLALLVGLVSFIMVGLYFFCYELEHSCVFQPRKVSQYETDLAELGLEQDLLPSGGVIWYDKILCRDPSYKERATILFVHGNSLNLDSLADALRLAKRENLRVAALDYRGYGMAVNVSPSCESVQQDALEAWIYMVNRCACADRTRAAPMILAGHSLGGAVCAQLVRDLACNPDLATIRMPDQLVLLQTFWDYQAIAVHFIGDLLSQILPLTCGWTPGQDLAEIYGGRCARRPPQNVLIVYSPDDHIIPAGHGPKLASFVPSGDVTLVSLPPTVDGSAHRTAIIRYWEEWSQYLFSTSSSSR